jgi:probable lipoprotein NlpC
MPRPDEEVLRAAQIEAFYHRWQGTSYQYGASGAQGIDCSALMVEAYDNLFDIRLPRTTEGQSKLGSRVKFSKLGSGDLVFFKTGVFDRHVGIYVGDGFFVHSSVSGGVAKSSLSHGYWHDHYWKARRLLD